MPHVKKTPDVPPDRLDEMLVRLKLSGIREQLDSLLDEAARSDVSARETPALLREREIARTDPRSCPACVLRDPCVGRIAVTVAG